MVTTAENVMPLAQRSDTVRALEILAIQHKYCVFKTPRAARQAPRPRRAADAGTAASAAPTEPLPAELLKPPAQPP